VRSLGTKKLRGSGSWIPAGAAARLTSCSTSAASSLLFGLRPTARWSASAASCSKNGPTSALREQRRARPVARHRRGERRAARPPQRISARRGRAGHRRHTDEASRELGDSDEVAVCVGVNSIVVAEPLLGCEQRSSEMSITRPYRRHSEVASRTLSVVRAVGAPFRLANGSRSVAEVPLEHHDRNKGDITHGNGR
jgi:hypothetical protein